MSALDYCDEIAHEIKEHLRENTRFRVIETLFDLHPEHGYLLSTKKTLLVHDTHHRRNYRIQIEAEDEVESFNTSNDTTIVEAETNPSTLMKGDSDGVS